MVKTIFNIVRTAEGSMTTYKVDGMKVADNSAICQALTEAAKDVWKYLTTIPATSGAYTAAQLAIGKPYVTLREGVQLPKALNSVQVVCGTFRCCVKLVANYYMLFGVLAQFESMARVLQKDRYVFTAKMDLGKLLCEARVVLPTDMKAICDCCGNDMLRPSLMYPAIDLDRRCIVATDCALLVAKKFMLVSIHYEGKVPETFYMPKEVARMQGEVTVQLYEKGCTVIDQNGTEVLVEHEAPYPRWAEVWPTYRSGVAIVDSKAMTKAVKGAVATMYFKGKGDKETVMLAHESQSNAISISGYSGAEKVNGQCMPNVTATDEVAWRLPMNAVRLLKVLALKPRTMYAGYTEHSALPSRIVMEDATAEMAVMLYQYMDEDLEKSLRETEADYAVCGSRGLYHCFDKDGWLLEQLETKYPTVGTETMIGTECTEKTENTEKVKPTFAEMLRKVLLAA